MRLLRQASIRPGWIWLFVLCLLSFVLAGCQHKQPQPLIELQITFIDVGQGDAALVQTPSGKVMLIDSGPQASRRMLAKVLKRLNIRKIDCMVLTHPDSDQIGGAESIVKRYPIGEVLTNGAPYDSIPAFRLNALMHQKGMPIRSEVAGQTYQLDDSVKLSFWNPASTLANGDNENSLVFRLSYGQTSVLFTGDVEGVGLTHCVRAAQPVDVLKVSHHGSSNGTTQELLQCLRPKAAIISVGANNSYGHPSEDICQLLKQYCQNVYRTDECGNITLRSDGKALSVKTQY